ncbi:hypothetical protein ACJIZ3_006066 [Penstemon smallii]|uniref:Uncharacterized protein n=1 Tax=Penstemon smallii TaxID=265156 RepID=A0ABD3S6M5_9LAMI
MRIAKLSINFSMGMQRSLGTLVTLKKY